MQNYYFEYTIKRIDSANTIITAEAQRNANYVYRKERKGISKIIFAFFALS